MATPAHLPTSPSVTPLAQGRTPRFREPTTDVRDALKRDQSDLQREVVLWQRWVRYMAFVVVVGVAAAFGPSDRPVPLVPLLSVAVAYASTVFLTGLAVERLPHLASRGWLLGLLITADLLTVGAVVYVTAAPIVSQRFLMVALLFVPLTAFYFGMLLAAYSAVLSCVVYLLIGEVLPYYVPGPRPVSSAINVALFTLVSAVLVYTFGRFRERMNQLRLFCKQVEEGDFAGSVDLATTRFPDDLTLLARSFDAMRSGLVEQIGTDPLTGCLNRRALESKLRADWRLAKRHGTHVGVVAVDLDHFKEVNDTRGHPVGDIVLQQLTAIMKGTARDTDSVARFGGDEFVMVLPDTGWQGALTFGERLRRQVEDFSFGSPGNPLASTISVGIALAKGTDPVSPEELLKDADRALYKAKQQGRNRVIA